MRMPSTYSKLLTNEQMNELGIEKMVDNNGGMCWITRSVPDEQRSG
jgi:hypothetical protein